MSAAGVLAQQQARQPAAVAARAAKKPTLAIVGLGYVGLPLAAEFGRIFRTVGFDLSQAKVESYRRKVDPTGQLGTDELERATFLEVTCNPALLKEADVIIVAVPTPVDSAHNPDFGPLVSASASVGKHMKRGAVVVYESTVYPGATEEVCIPVLERSSGMRWKQDFFVGYSPERINPGDAEHTLSTIVKVVAGDTPETLELVADIYSAVVKAGVHRVSCIKVAEAAKVIENTQRDLNIALVNELAIIFHTIGIDTQEVLTAAATKWNFLPFRPGLVGGHCIGVDPYYLTYKAETLGYHPQVILSGRKINDGMGKYIAEQTIKRLIHRGFDVTRECVAVLGLTFKENCPDIRNSRVVDVIRELQAFGVKVVVHDPIADPHLAIEEYGIELVSWEALPRAAAIVAAVAHNCLISRSPADYIAKLAPRGIYVDVKSRADAAELAQHGVEVWRL